MRPVDKGPDQGVFNPYTNAQQLLVTHIGEYCSYSERWIASAIHVEHKLPKNDYPNEKFLWANFLLSCSNCNSGKGYGNLELVDYLWPDMDNTFLAFCYDSEGRVSVSQDLDANLFEKAQRTWIMLGLNRHPDRFTIGLIKPTNKDRRWLHRKEEWQKALHQKQGLTELDTPERRESIVETAAARGMFSVWMTVFNNDSDIRKRLIKRFTGTAIGCFDEEGSPISRLGGQLLFMK